MSYLKLVLAVSILVGGSLPAHAEEITIDASPLINSTRLRIDQGSYAITDREMLSALFMRGPNEEPLSHKERCTKLEKIIQFRANLFSEHLGESSGSIVVKSDGDNTGDCEITVSSTSDRLPLKKLSADKLNGFFEHYRKDVPNHPGNRDPLYACLDSYAKMSREAVSDKSVLLSGIDVGVSKLRQAIPFIGARHCQPEFLTIDTSRSSRSTGSRESAQPKMCLDIDPDTAAPETRCYTTSGHLYERISLRSGISGWKADSGLIWFPGSSDHLSYPEARSLCSSLNGRLPTAKEFTEAEGKELRELLPFEVRSRDTRHVLRYLTSTIARDSDEPRILHIGRLDSRSYIGSEELELASGMVRCVKK